MRYVVTGGAGFIGSNIVKKLVARGDSVTVIDDLNTGKEENLESVRSKITFLKPRSGERYASALTKISNNNKIIQKYGKIQLKDYISSFIKSSNL